MHRRCLVNQAMLGSLKEDRLLGGVGASLVEREPVNPSTVQALSLTSLFPKHP